MQKNLVYLDGETLLTTSMPPITFVVEQLLPQGLNILAGAPKVGKSWLALWLCLCVAKGEKVWDFPSVKSDVLYLCLEDSYSRIQSRLLDITLDAPDTLFFATMSEKLGYGLEQQIEEFLARHPNTSLIVIDTLQRIRSNSNEVSPYASDYRDLGILKELADKHRISILLIHHLRKMKDDDPMNMISGTTGISGATDSNFVLCKDSRDANTATLYCTGRDIEYRELSLEFDTSAHLWKLLSDSVTEPPEPCDKVLKSLLSLLQKNGSFTGTATELTAELEQFTGEVHLPHVLMKHLVRRRDELARLGIVYESSRTRSQRRIDLSLCCDSNDGSDGNIETESVSNFLSQPSQLSPDADCCTTM